MAVLILPGEKLNALERANLIAVSSENSVYPKARLYGGDPSDPFKFNAAAANDQITVDNDLLAARGDFETWSGGSPVGWTEVNTGTGDVVQETTTKNTGASSAKLATGTGTASAYIDVTVRAGEKLNIEWALYGDTSGTIRLRVQHRQRNVYLKSDGTWDTPGSVIDVATKVGTGWSASSRTFTVDAMGAGEALVTLRITVLCNDSSKNVFADSIFIYPAIDFLSIHGHNIDPQITVEFRSSTDNFSASDTLEGSATIVHPAFYKWLSSPVYRRYWRVRFLGTNTQPIELGELVMGQARSLSHAMEDDWSLEEMEAQIVERSGSRRPSVSNQTRRPNRRVTATWSHYSRTEYEELRDEVFRRCRGAFHPIVIVPSSAEAEVVFARLDPTVKVSKRSAAGYWFDMGMTFEEMPFSL